MVRVAALGDFGTGDQFQARVARALCDHLTNEPFTHVATTGDNIYPFGDPRDFEPNFFEPYECLFDQGVRWHASLGNHDAFTGGGQAEVDEPAFGMKDAYYSWRLGPLAFVMLDSNDFDDFQLEWLDGALDEAKVAPWTIVVFHHPVYGAGLRHGSTPGFEEMLASTFATSGVDLVLNGHDHLYTRATNRDVTYLVTGGGGATLDVCRIPLPDPINECFSALHYVVIEATRSALTATAIMDTGKVIETVEILPND
ncbi:MAG: metallophosphoesterase family protein [Actinomycetota bacterium]